MRGVCKPAWWLLALVVAWTVPLVAAHAKAAAQETRTLTGKISGVPMGTWMTLATGAATSSTTPGTTYQVDLSHAKITEKGKTLKRYSLADGMKVRVKGSTRGTAFAAESVEILERAKPKKP